MVDPLDPDGLDAAALLAKYDRERDKRLRSDGIAQYATTRGVFEHFIDDVWAGDRPERAALTDEVEVIVIGGGFGGLLTGGRLRQKGFRDIRMVEKAADFGGAWYWNRYPGVACDIESYIYLPLLEELGYMPEKRYASGSEIRRHCRRIAEHFDLYRDACLQTVVTGMEWDDTASRWTVRTDRGDAMRSQFVVLANGPLDRPKLPGAPGIEDFSGHCFHTGRWDYSYTGGDSDGGMDNLKDQVVGVVGTGATAVQCIPRVARYAKRLYVFQRTPSGVDVRDDCPTDSEWVAGLPAGWQNDRIANFTRVTSGEPVEDLVADGWTDMVRNVMMLAERRRASGRAVDDPKELAQLADLLKMEQIRARVASTVTDPATAEALKPYYNQFCKRPTFADDYLPTFNRPNVTLVDTDGQGIEKVSADGVIANGVEYKLDCLIFATGFEVGSEYTSRIRYDPVGRDGAQLSDRWADGASTLHGFLTHGFPNMFILSHIQSGWAFNFAHLISEQAKHVSYLIDATRRSGANRIEATVAAQQAWVANATQANQGREEFLANCTPGYYNYEGGIGSGRGRNAAYQGGMMEWVDVLERWRAAGDLAGVELT